jgi:ribosomal-protein-alanine N-acetyltransferase
VIDALETKRLRLRRFRGSDLDGLTAMFSDPEAMRFLKGPRDRETCLADLRKYIANAETLGWAPMAVVRKDNEQLIGRCGIWPCKVDEVLQIEIGYFIERGSWGHGYATEACAALITAGFQQGLERIITIINPDNVASQRVAEKLGLAYEKTTTVDGQTAKIYTIAKR